MILFKMVRGIRLIGSKLIYLTIIIPIITTIIIPIIIIITILRI